MKNKAINANKVSHIVLDREKGKFQIDFHGDDGYLISSEKFETKKEAQEYFEDMVQRLGLTTL